MTGQYRIIWSDGSERQVEAASIEKARTLGVMLGRGRGLTVKTVDALGTVTPTPAPGPADRKPAHVRQPSRRWVFNPKGKPLCRVCHQRPCEARGGHRFHHKCWKCRRPNRDTRGNRSYRLLVDLSRCTLCGFVPTHESQMDVHHKDSNWSNSDPDNLVGVCANCHRLIEWRLNNGLDALGHRRAVA